MALDDSLDDEEVPTTLPKQGAANPKRVKLSANNSTPVAIPRVNTRASAGQRVQNPSGQNGGRRKKQ